MPYGLEFVPEHIKRMLKKMQLITSEPDEKRLMENFNKLGGNELKEMPFGIQPNKGLPFSDPFNMTAKSNNLGSSVSNSLTSAGSSGAFSAEKLLPGLGSLVSGALTGAGWVGALPLIGETLNNIFNKPDPVKTAEMVSKMQRQTLNSTLDKAQSVANDAMRKITPPDYLRLMEQGNQMANDMKGTINAQNASNRSIGNNNQSNYKAQELANKAIFDQNTKFEELVQNNNAIKGRISSDAINSGFSAGANLATNATQGMSQEMMRNPNWMTPLLGAASRVGQGYLDKNMFKELEEAGFGLSDIIKYFFSKKGGNIA